MQVSSHFYNFHFWNWGESVAPSQVEWQVSPALAPLLGTRPKYKRYIHLHRELSSLKGSLLNFSHVKAIRKHMPARIKVAKGVCKFVSFANLFLKTTFWFLCSFIRDEEIDTVDDSARIYNNSPTPLIQLSKVLCATQRMQRRLLKLEVVKNNKILIQKVNIRNTCTLFILSIDYAVASDAKMLFAVSVYIVAWFGITTRARRPAGNISSNECWHTLECKYVVFFLLLFFLLFSSTLLRKIQREREIRNLHGP